METHRREHSYRIRVEAAKAARRRNHPEHRSNPDEQRYASAHYAMSFTKGLEHDAQTGLVLDPHHFEAFREAINAGLIDPFTLNVPTPTTPPFTNDKRRGWEAPTAGLVYDLEGPDAQAVTMQPAPALGSDELAYEMAEVYELALLRDVPLTAFSGVTAAVTESVDRLNALAYSTTGYPSRPRKTNPNGNVTPGLAFRGSSPDVDVGPYLSQFLLIGTAKISRAALRRCGRPNSVRCSHCGSTCTCCGGADRLHDRLRRMARSPGRLGYPRRHQAL